MPKMVYMGMYVLLLAGFQAGCGEKSGAGDNPNREQNAGQKDVRQFLETYFKSWSDADFKTYQSCFASQSAIQYRRKSGELKKYELKTFMEIQKKVHKRGDGKIEVPLEINVTIENGYARCLVKWQLTQKDEVKKGYDHFLLMKDGEAWRIVSLLFYDE